MTTLSSMISCRAGGLPYINLGKACRGMPSERATWQSEWSTLASGSSASASALARPRRCPSRSTSVEHAVGSSTFAAAVMGYRLSRHRRGRLVPRSHASPWIGEASSEVAFTWEEVGSFRRELRLYIPVGDEVGAKDIDFELSHRQLQVGLKSRKPIIEGTLWGGVDVDLSSWTLEDHSGKWSLVVSLFKEKSFEAWARPFSHVEIGVQAENPEVDHISSEEALSLRARGLHARRTVATMDPFNWEEVGKSWCGVNVFIPIGEHVGLADVDFELSVRQLKVELKGRSIINGRLWGEVDTETSSWAIGDHMGKRSLLVYLAKRYPSGSWGHPFTPGAFEARSAIVDAAAAEAETDVGLAREAEAEAMAEAEAVETTIDLFGAAHMDEDDSWPMKDSAASQGSPDGSLQANPFTWDEHGFMKREVRICIPVGAHVCSKDVQFDLSRRRLEVGLSGRGPILCGDLAGEVDVDIGSWALEEVVGRRCLVVSLIKEPGFLGPWNFPFESGKYEAHTSIGESEIAVQHSAVSLEPAQEEVSVAKPVAMSRAEPHEVGQLEPFTWCQSGPFLNEVKLSVPLGEGVNSEDVFFWLSSTRLEVGLKGRSPIVEGTFMDEVNTQRSYCQLEQHAGHFMVMAIHLEKQPPFASWSSLFKPDTLVTRSLGRDHREEGETLEQLAEELEAEPEELEAELAQNQLQGEIAEPTSESQEIFQPETSASGSVAGSGQTTRPDPSGAGPEEASELEPFTWEEEAGNKQQELNIYLPIGTHIVAKDIDFELSGCHLRVGLKGQSPLVSGTLTSDVDTDLSSWTLEDRGGRRALAVHLIKDRPCGPWPHPFKDAAFEVKEATSEMKVAESLVAAADLRAKVSRAEHQGRSPAVVESEALKQPEFYTWEESGVLREEISVLIPVDQEDIHAEDIYVEVSTTRLRVGVKGQKPIVEGKLWGDVDPNDSQWTVYEQEGNKHAIYISLSKELGFSHVDDMDLLKSWWRLFRFGNEAQQQNSRAAWDPEQEEPFTWHEHGSFRDEVSVFIAVGESVSAREIDFELTSTYLKVGLRGQHPILEGQLWADVVVELSSWQMVVHNAERCVMVRLTKLESANWWGLPFKPGKFETRRVAKLRAPDREQQAAEPTRESGDGESQFFVDALMLTDITGKGIGYIATRDVKKGEVLLREASFCFSDAQGIEFVDMAAQHNSRADSPLYEEVMSLSVADGRERSMMEVLQSNAIHCSRENKYMALFPKTSRFNHSCCPNAFVDGTHMQATVRALQDIASGEEVSISYIPLNTSRADRQKLLWQRGFTCTCLRCKAEARFDPYIAVRCGCGKTNFRIGTTRAQRCRVCDGVFDGEKSLKQLQEVRAMNDLIMSEEATVLQPLDLATRLEPMVRAAEAQETLLPRQHVEVQQLINNFANTHFLAATTTPGPHVETSLESFCEYKGQALASSDETYGRWTNQRDLNFFTALYVALMADLFPEGRREELRVRLADSCELHFGVSHVPSELL